VQRRAEGNILRLPNPPGRIPAAAKSELIFRKDWDGEVYTRTAVGIDGSGPFRLVAEVEGGLLDPAHAELRADPKAVTFHQFALARADGGWRARIVIDI
jgi:SHS2 domain-containing protein